MTRTIDYTTPTERTDAIADAKALGESVIHDDFGIGDNGRNRLTVGVKAPHVDSADEIALRDARDNAGPLNPVQITDVLRAKRLI